MGSVHRSARGPVSWARPPTSRHGAAPFVDLALPQHDAPASISLRATPQPAVVRAAAAPRGLTHLAITDHDRIDGALRARDGARTGLTVIVGEEIKTDTGDLIAVFLERAVPPGLSVAETIADVREQGGLVGVPHPFDRLRGSMGKKEALEAMAGLVDWVEAYNARVLGGSGNEQAATVRPRARPAGGRGERRPLHARGRRRLHGPHRRPVHGRGPARGPAQRRAGHGPGDLLRAARDAGRQGRPARARQRPGRHRAGASTSPGESSEPGSSGPSDDPGATGPSVDGRRPPIRPYPPMPMQVLRPATVPAVPAPSADPDREAVDQLSLGRRLRQPRTIVSLVLPLILLFLLARTLPGFDLEALPGIIGAANPLLILAAFAIYYWASRCAACAGRSSLRGSGHVVSPRDAHRDHLHQLARELPRAGQARRHLPGVPAEDQLDRVAQPDLRDRLHRAHPRHLRDRASLASGPAT